MNNKEKYNKKTLKVLSKRKFKNYEIIKSTEFDSFMIIDLHSINNINSLLTNLINSEIF